MNGAQALIRTLVGSGVDVCFANPGTSEMHFVAALDDVPEMRAVLGLFEGVVTGAADGYGRMARAPGGHAAAPRARARQRHRQPPQRPAGPDPGRQRRRRPRHDPHRATTHRWPRTSRAWPGRCRAGSGRRRRPEALGRRRGRRRGGGVRSARRRGHAGGAGRRLVARGRRARRRAGPAGPRHRWPTTPWSSAAKALRSGEPAGAPRRWERAAEHGACVAASRVAGASGAKLLCETFPARLERGAGLPAGRAPRVPGRVHHRPAPRGAAPGPRRRARPRVVLRLPGHAGRTSSPTGCEVHILADAGPTTWSARSRPWPTPWGRPPARRRSRRRRARTGPPARSNAQTMAAAIGALLPEGADRQRRGEHVGALRVRRHRRRTAPRLAVPHRRGHRPGPPRGHRRRRGVPRPAGAVPRGRRQRHVHAPVAVDPGARGARRDHGDPQQRLVRHLGAGAQPGGCGRPRPPGRRHARPQSVPTSTSWRWPRAWASPPRGRRPPRSSRPNWSGPSRRPGPALVEAVLR